MRRLIFFFNVIIAVFLFVSCGTAKKLIYMQDLDHKEMTKIEDVAKQKPIIIEKNDNLLITISSINKEAVELFNNVQKENASFNNFSEDYKGYLVGLDGMIKLPLIGKVKVAGLTKQEAEALLQLKIAKYAFNPMVNIRFLNFKVIILGEVNKPGVYSSPDERMTLLGAIAKAGDLTVYGRRDGILILRNDQFGKKYARIDLKSSEFLHSPFFYLKRGDVIYVEPTDTKAYESSELRSNIPLIFSSVSTLITITTFLLTLLKK